MATIGRINGPCSSQKKNFATEQDALSFEEKNRAMYRGIRQYAYLCEECNNYHLSALPPDARNAVANYSKIENGRSAETTEKWRRVTEEEKQEIVTLRKQGLSVKQIAERVGVSSPTVLRYSKSNGQASVSAPTLDSLASEEKELEAKLQRLREEKQRIIEFKLLKAVKLPEGQVSIRKELQSMTLSTDDALDLAVKLSELLELAN